MTDYAVFYLELYLLVHSRPPVLLSDDARCSRNPLVGFMSQLNDVVSQIFRDNNLLPLKKYSVMEGQLISYVEVRSKFWVYIVVLWRGLSGVANDARQNGVIGGSLLKFLM